MTNRDKLAANERREEQFRWAEDRCCYCGGWLRSGIPQLAHRVIHSKHNAETIRPDVLHHPANTIPVCGLACNSKMILHGQEAAELLARVERVLAGEEPFDCRAYYAELREAFSRLRVGSFRGGPWENLDDQV